MSTGWSIYSTSNSTDNESPNRSLGQLSPFEVYFGRKPNKYRNKLFLGGKKDYEVPNNNRIEMDECKAEELTEPITECSSIRQEALDASNKASQYMVKRELRRNPPSLYYKEETVLIRVPVSKELVKGRKNSLKNTGEGVIVEADHSVHKYFISYSDTVTLKSKLGKKAGSKKQKLAVANRVVERCNTTQPIASSVIVAEWMNLVWNRVQQKQAVPHVG